MALATLGFFFAPISEKPLRAGLWLLGVAVDGVGSPDRGLGARRIRASGSAVSVAGALLVVRGGSRAARYYLPEAGNEAGSAAAARDTQGSSRSRPRCSSVDTSSIGGSERSSSSSQRRFFFATFFSNRNTWESRRTPLPLEIGNRPLSAVGGARAVRGHRRHDASQDASRRRPEHIAADRSTSPRDRGDGLRPVTDADRLADSARETSELRRRRRSRGGGTAVLVELESWDRVALSGVRLVLHRVSGGPADSQEIRRSSFSHGRAAPTLVPPVVLAVMMAPVTAIRARKLILDERSSSSRSPS